MKEFERGQILLIVVLVMVTALTIALSVAARSITNSRTSDEAAKSEQAFSAAEAGIEKSLTTNNPVGTTTLANGAQYKTTIITVGGVEFPLNNGSPVLKDEPADLWLSTYPGYTAQRSGNVTIFWGKPGDTCSANESNNKMAALEIIVFSGTLANPHTTRYAVDPCAPRSLANHFQNIGAGGDTILGVDYNFQTSFVVNSGLFVRIVPLYAPTIIAARGCDAANANCTPFPTQGTLIQAVGTVSDTERKLQTYRYYPQLPAEILQYSFFIPK